MGSESPPAGFFSTFSVNDPNSGSNGGGDNQQKVTKRNRRVFVCLSCHRKKLKCDKNSPCGRCVANGTADECIYQPVSSAASRSGRSSERQESSSTRASSQVGTRDHYLWFYRPSDGKCRATGASHWATVCAEFEEACPYLFGTDPRWEPRYRQIKNLKYLFPSVAGGSNFPFSSGSSYVASREQILDSLPPRNVVDMLLQCYMDTFETTHRLFHQGQFRPEMDAFWADRLSVSDGWLAQLCAMLALGCQTASPAALLVATGQAASHWTDILLDGAQISFSRSSYMLMPNLASIRTLCLMVLAKMTGLRGTNSWQVASLMAFVVRLAMSMQLHRSSSLFHGMPVLEAEMRRRVWTTVQLLDLDVAFWAGTTPNCREQDADPPLNANDADFMPAPHHQSADGLLWPGIAANGGGSGSSCGGSPAAGASGDYTDGVYQAKLADMLPILGDIAASVNSPTNTSIGIGSSGSKSSGSSMEYDRVQRLDKRLRRALRDAEAVLSSGREARPDRASILVAQRQLLRVLAHRAILALHHVFAKGSGPARQEQSLRTTLTSSLALLHIQQQLAAVDPVVNGSPPANSMSLSIGGRGPTSSSSSSPVPISLAWSQSQTQQQQQHQQHQQRQWLLDVCRDDFSIATAHAILALRRGDFDEDGPVSSTQQDNNSNTFPSPDVVRTLVRRAMGIARDQACRSVLHFKEFTGLSILLACLRSGSLAAAPPRRGSGTSDRPNRSPSRAGVDRDSLLLQASMQAANDVEEVVLAGKSEYIWSSTNAAAAAAAAASSVNGADGSTGDAPGLTMDGVVQTSASSVQYQQQPHQQGVIMQHHSDQVHHYHPRQGTHGEGYTMLDGYGRPYQ